MSKRNIWGFGPAMQKGLLLSTVAVLCTLGGSQIATAATISLVPVESSVSVGDTVTVDLDVSGLAANAAPSLGGFDITIGIPSIFTFSNVTFGDPTLGDQLELGGASSLALSFPGSSSIELLEVSFATVANLNSLQPDAFTLAVLTFTANAPGSASLTLGNITLSDASGAPLASSISNASVGVNAVTPEPSTLLPLAGLMLVAVTMRKRFFSMARG